MKALDAIVQVTEQEFTERAERPVLHREYAAEITRGDGRTVDVRIVPFGETITHNDGMGGVPRGVEYRERWAPGVFNHQMRAADKVVGNFEHQPGIGGIVARGISLRETPDGVHGEFRMLKGQDADKVLELIESGTIDGVSLEARPVKAVKTSDGVVERVRADLRAIAFTRFAAYAGARVLAVREEDDKPQQFVDAGLLPVDLDPEVVERCRRLGLKLPQRYEAHPAITDTPDESGTSEDGTRQADNTQSSEE